MKDPAGAKAGALQTMHVEWARFLEVAQSFPVEEQLKPGAVGHWSVREALLHMAAWNEELVRQIDTYRATGEEIDYGDDAEIDALNERQVREKEGYSLKEVWSRARESYNRMREFLQKLPESAFDPGSYDGQQVQGETMDHFVEHREDLERALRVK